MIMDMVEHIRQVDEEYAEILWNMGKDNDDPERNHMAADDMLIEIIRAFGFHKTADAFEDLPKWYA